eukprot:TRINITY_DN12532_c0_g1_i1.p1 TRINITY_DN12532_c0_g1~~TRINITY_DN12532_c0_g1_i1.p1  ORF type:complete len:172 (-),score=37.87 TRINITY_DN12532_c0_g1_i1:45-560(-)
MATNRDSFVFFWSEKDAGKGCFSNWHPSKFKDPHGLEYCCTEQWMMKKKADLFGDAEIGDQIMKTSSPRKIKELGRKVRSFDKDVWNKQALDVVTEGCYYKFTQNPDLKDFILSTQNATIVEASPLDAVWGIGMAQDDPDASNPSRWKGTNWLGQALMRVRDRILSEQNKS